jgi:hypothetical protein
LDLLLAAAAAAAATVAAFKNPCYHKLRLAQQQL